jgi:hypothetical protein
MPFTVGMVLIAWVALVKLRRQNRRPVLAAAGIAAAMVAVVVLAPPLFYYASPNVLLGVVLAVLFLLLFLGLPIAFVLALAAPGHPVLHPRRHGHGLRRTDPAPGQAR